jgi:flagellar biosynthesis/type III secretory pathway M-ring protein FliF/YscJ
MVDIQQVSGRVRESSLKQVQEVIDTYPEESVNVVRGWMAGSNSASEE